MLSDPKSKVFLVMVFTLPPPAGGYIYIFTYILKTVYSGLKMALEMPTVMELPTFELPVSFISPLRMLGLVVGLAKHSHDQQLHRASRSIHEYHNIYSMKTKSIHLFLFPK